jgi:hypothetical protein
MTAEESHGQVVNMHEQHVKCASHRPTLLKVGDFLKLPKFLLLLSHSLSTTRHNTFPAMADASDGDETDTIETSDDKISPPRTARTWLRTCHTLLHRLLQWRPDWILNRNQHISNRPPCYLLDVLPREIRDEIWALAQHESQGIRIWSSLWVVLSCCNREC